MSITVTTDVFCDEPGCRGWTYGPTGPRSNAREARRIAKTAAWRCTRKGDWCPEHATLAVRKVART